MSDRYDSVEFGTIAYQTAGLGCPDSIARVAYYGYNAYPHVVFNGDQLIVGTGPDTSDGSVYDPIVRRMLDDATPMKLTIVSYDFDVDPHVTVEIELENYIADITDTYLRVAVVEDSLSFYGSTYDHVLRDMLADTPLTIRLAGQTQQVTLPITMDAWNPANTWIAAFVQRDSDWHIYQTITTHPVPDYSFRYYALGERMVVDSGTHSFDDFALFNTGLNADTIDITLDQGELPPGWSAHFTDGVDNFTSTSVSLTPGERSEYNVVIDAASTGNGTVTVTFHSQSGQASDRQLTYTVITADTQVLLVDDDGPYEYEIEYFAPAIEAAGYSYAIWDRNLAGVSVRILQNFDAVVWNCGSAFPTVDADDRVALSAYLNRGGKLFLSGQDIGRDMNDEGGDAIDWYHNYLHADYVSDDTNDYILTGEDFDPIGDGLFITIARGDGADNQDDPSDIDPHDAFASIVFRYDASRNGAIKADTGYYRVVYFAFGYEAINNVTDRTVIMHRILDWLIDDINRDGEVPGPLYVTQNVPNPFNPETAIRFSVGQKSKVRLEIFDVAGRLVHSVSEQLYPAGTHTFVWNGHDSDGKALASGTYFYRVHTDDHSETRKMVMLK